jgi:hypothetical protein
VPPLALSPEHPPALGHLGPGDGIGDEGHLPGPAMLVPVATEPHHELHVLADGVVEVPAGVDYGVAPEEPEGAGNDEVPTEPVPAEAPEEECAQVLHDLDPGERRPGRAGPRYAALVHVGAIDHADRSAGGQQIIIGEEGPDQPLERVVLDEGIRVDDTGQLAGREVERRVQRVRLAAVLLVDHHQLRVGPRAVGGAYRLRVQPPPVDGRYGGELEGVHQDFERAVGGAVIHHDDLETRIV